MTTVNNAGERESRRYFNKPATKKQQEALRRLKDLPDSEIDYSDIPPLTEDQLAFAFRPQSNQLIAVRLDRDVLAWLKGIRTRVLDPHQSYSARGYGCEASCIERIPDGRR